MLIDTRQSNFSFIYNEIHTFKSSRRFEWVYLSLRYTEKNDVIIIDVYLIRADEVGR